MQHLTTRGLALALVAVALAACDDSRQSDPSIQAPQRPQGVFLQQGRVKRLNLPNAAAEASVAFKDPVQGVKDAAGECRFPNLGKLRTGLGFAVGEWNVDTCAGLVYYFRNSGRPYPKPTREDTTVISSAAALGADGLAVCNSIANGIYYVGGPDTIIARQAIVGYNAGSSSWTDTVGRTKLVLYGGHSPSNALNGGCARINTGLVIRSTWSLTGQYYTYYAMADSGTRDVWEPQQAPVNPNGVGLARLRSASRYYRVSSFGDCDHGHPLGVRYNPASYPANLNYGQSTWDIGWYSTGSHYFDWGVPGLGAGYYECDDGFHLFDKLYVGGIDKETP